MASESGALRFRYEPAVSSIAFGESGLDWRGEPTFAVHFLGADKPILPEEFGPDDVEGLEPFPSRSDIAGRVERLLQAAGYSLRRVRPTEASPYIAEWEVVGAEARRPAST